MQARVLYVLLWVHGAAKVRFSSRDRTHGDSDPLCTIDQIVSRIGFSALNGVLMKNSGTRMSSTLGMCGWPTPPWQGSVSS